MANKTKLEIRKAISDYRKYVNETIVDALIKPVGKSTKESFAEKFIAKYMSNALKDTSSREAQFLASVLIKQDALEQLQLSEASNRNSNVDLTLWKINNTLYDKQQEVFSSFLHAAYKRYIIINSRRTGKTELMGRLIAANLVAKQDAHVVYINRNSSAAVRQIKRPLENALAQTDLQIIKGSIESQFIEFNNGSQLLIIGNNNAADIDRARGERISLCIMDECGHQRNTRQILREVIEPAMSDYGDEARLVLVGTPPRIPHTYIEDVWNNADKLGWKKFHWTFYDNPHLKDRDKLLDDVCKSNGVTVDSPFIQREYFGRMGLYDHEAQVFYGYQVCKEIPKQTFTHAYIGVDWGFEDKAAVVAVLADSKTKKAYIVKDWTESKQSISTICEKVVELKSYITTNFAVVNPVQIICDTNEKSAVYELSQTYKLPHVTLAYKYDKDLAIEQLAEWLRAGTILTTDGATACKADFDNTLWVRDEETDKLTHEIDDDLYHPNAAMALLYISRQFDYDSMVTGYSKTAKDIIGEILGK